METNALAVMGSEIPLRDGRVVVLPLGEFAPPSEEVRSMLGNPRIIRAVHKYLHESSVSDADGVQLQANPFVADAYLRAGDFTRGLPITEGNSDVDAYLRARTVFERPELFAPERRTSNCDTCGRHGLGWMHMACDAMLTPSEVLFLGDCCSRAKT